MPGILQHIVATTVKAASVLTLPAYRCARPPPEASGIATESAEAAGSGQPPH